MSNFCTCVECVPDAEELQTGCQHTYECTYEGMDGERYRCSKCGESYFLDYEEMK